MAEYDAVVVGSGINSLACGALLARGGWRVCVLERNDWLGGAIKTAELTEPGFHHDVFSGWHPQWVASAAYDQLRDELAARGLEYLNTELPTATAYPDGQAAYVLRSTDATAAELERHAAGDGDAWRVELERFQEHADLTLGMLRSELWGSDGLVLGARAARRLGRRGLAELGAGMLLSGRDWLESAFRSERAHGLLAPWVLHTGVGPEAATSGFRMQVIVFAKQTIGSPLPRGGGARLPEALVRLIRDRGGVCETGRDVERVLVRGGRAVGVRVTGGETVTAQRAVVASVTPTQLYGRLLADAAVPAAVAAAARRFRYGRAAMQIHVALSEPPCWAGDERLGGTAIVHVTPGLDGVSRAVNEAERGLLPTEATVVVGQPLTVDPSRAPEGKGILWIQIQELPWRVKGDAAGELDVGSGEWTDELRERYADRIQARLARHIPNLESSILQRVVLGPRDLAAANVNLERGDPYGGSLALDQNLLLRPFPRSPGHRTPVERLWHIGASTWPGPGLSGGSGALVAHELLRPRTPQRALAELRPFVRRATRGLG